MKLAVSLIVTALGLYALVHITLVAGHFWETGWLPHAVNHLFRGTLASLGLVVVTIVILTGPFRRKEHWAWWLVLLTFLFLYGGFWGGYLVTEFSVLSDKLDMVLLFSVQTLLFVVGLYMSYKSSERWSATQKD